MKRQAKSLDEKRKEIEQLTEDMNEKVHAFFDSEEKIKEHLKFMSNFHDYSLQNQLLIKNQFMGAHAVGSFNFWKEQGASVKKGEKGIKVLVPTPVKFFQRDNEWLPVNKANQNEKSSIKKGDIETRQKTFFKIGHVFEYTQTNAREKGLEVSEIFGRYHRSGDIENDQELMESFSKLSEKMGVEIRENSPFELGTAKGAYLRNENAIVLNPRNSTADNVGVMIHELAHADLHNHESNSEREKQLSRNEKEYQAEMTAYVVANHYGIDTESFSLPYISSWAKNVELSQKKSLLQEVHKTSSKFIKTIDEELTSVEKERENKMLEKEGFEKVYLVTYDSLSSAKLSEKNEEEIKQAILKKMEQTNDFDKFKQLDSLYSSEKLDENFIQEFNRHFKENYALFHESSINEPKMLIRWSESDEFESNEFIRFAEGSERMIKVADHDDPVWGYFKTRYNVLVKDKEDDQVNIINTDRIDLGDGYFNSPMEQIEFERRANEDQMKALNDDILDYKGISHLFNKNERNNQTREIANQGMER